MALTHSDSVFVETSCGVLHTHKGTDSAFQLRDGACIRCGALLARNKVWMPDDFIVEDK